MEGSRQRQVYGEDRESLPLTLVALPRNEQKTLKTQREREVEREMRAVIS